jgi:hypothetical protein
MFFRSDATGKRVDTVKHRPEIRVDLEVIVAWHAHAASCSAARLSSLRSAARHVAQLARVLQQLAHEFAQLRSHG